jgi:Spy/CpxP family protein refolding chaperone
MEGQSMKTLNAILIATVFAAPAASAQAPSDQPAPPHGQHGQRGPHAPPGLDIDRLTVLLDLDPYQKSQVQDALDAEREAMRAGRKANETSGTRPTLAEMQARRTESQQQLITKLTGVLTDAQITKLKVLMEPPQGGRGAGFRGPPPAAGN